MDYIKLGIKRYTSKISDDNSIDITNLDPAGVAPYLTALELSGHGKGDWYRDTYNWADLNKETLGYFTNTYCIVNPNDIIWQKNEIIIPAFDIYFRCDVLDLKIFRSSGKFLVGMRECGKGSISKYEYRLYYEDAKPFSREIKLIHEEQRVFSLLCSSQRDVIRGLLNFEDVEDFTAGTARAIEVDAKHVEKRLDNDDSVIYYTRGEIDVWLSDESKGTISVTSYHGTKFHFRVDSGDLIELSEQHNTTPVELEMLDKDRAILYY